MADISQVFSELPDNDRKTLILGMQKCAPTFVVFAPGRYIGVDTARLKNLKPEQVKGRWAIGSLEATYAKRLYQV